MITLLNTSILTNYGNFNYSSISLDYARLLLKENEYQSAIGHQTTAEIMTELLESPVLVNRIEYRQEIGELALVFKLRGRPPEGAILSKEELEKIGYDFGLIIRTS